MFRLQELYCDREKLRFEHLIAAPELNDSVQWASLDSLSAIYKIIESQWNDRQETTLREANPDYTRLCDEIDKYGAAVNKTDTAGPYQDAKRDPEYVRARQVAAEAVAACDRRLTR